MVAPRYEEYPDIQFTGKVLEVNGEKVRPLLAYLMRPGDGVATLQRSRYLPATYLVASDSALNQNAPV